MHDQTTSRPADPASWSLIEAALNQFEAAWKSGETPDISHYLQASPVADSPALRRKLLTELVMTDLEYRWKRADETRSPEDSPGGTASLPPRLADYVARYPEFGPLGKLSEELIAEEYRARRLGGDRPTQEAYLQEFGRDHPGLANALAEVDRDLDARPCTPEPAETLAVPPATPSAASPLAAPEPRKAVAGEKSDHGHFRVLQPLEKGKGGMGQVSLAEDKPLQRQVAIKEILEHLADDPVARQRFVREARITGRLQHPGVVPVYALGVDRQGRPFYAMRRIQGQTLSAAIDEYHPPPPKDNSLAPNVPGQPRTDNSLAPVLRGEGGEGGGEGHSSPARLRELLRRFVAICQTVAYAHARSVLHRDLKPSNVMLGDFGETLVLDWGLAKPVAGGQTVTRSASERGACQTEQSPSDDGAAEPLSQRPDLTAPGTQPGSPPYMALEQAEGDLQAIGPATDVYGLGAILYHVLTGSAPYSGKSRAEIIEKVRSGPPRKPTAINATVPRPLEATCLKAMARAPADRYPDPLALAGDVQNWLDDEPVSAYPERIRERAFRWIRHHPQAAVASVVCLLSLSTAAAVGTVVVQRERARTSAALQLAAEYAQQAKDAQEKAKQLDREAEQARGESREHAKRAMAATTEAKDAKARIAVLQDKIKTGTGEAAQLKEQLQTVQATLAAAEAQTADQVQKAQLAKERAETLERESAQLQREADRLRGLAAEMSRLASGLPPEPPPPPPPAPVPEDFTKEPALACDLGTGDGRFSLMTRDNSVRLTADSSLRIDTLSENGVCFTHPSERNARWDLTSQKYLRLALWAPDPKKDRLQNVQVRLGRGSSYVEYQPPATFLDQARTGWVRVAIPLSGDANWQRRETNRPDLKTIDWMELHAATNAGQLTFWLDDLGFSPDAPAVRPELTLNKVVPVEATTTQGSKIVLPGGDISWADALVSFTPGDPAPQRSRDPKAALGKPDYRGTDDAKDEATYVALGHGGALVLEFADNVLVDGKGPDLAIFEIGPEGYERTLVAISEDGKNWTDVGHIRGSICTVDIAPFVKPGQRFRFVKLTDAKAGQSTGEWPGADIDAVGAINTLPFSSGDKNN